MAEPLVIDVPHSLGREEARRRIASRVGELPRHIPGGVAKVESSWLAEDRMALRISAMGQELDAALLVEESRVRVSVVLPPMLSFMSGAIAEGIRGGTRLLLDDRSGG